MIGMDSHRNTSTRGVTIKVPLSLSFNPLMVSFLEVIIIVIIKIIIILKKINTYCLLGYSPLSWDNSTQWKTHPLSFIFSLSNPHSLPPTRFSLKPGNPYAILCCPSSNKYSFAFGGGSDIIVCSDSHSSNHSFFKFPFSYVDTTGKGRLMFTGTEKFTTRDIEVYLCSNNN